MTAPLDLHPAAHRMAVLIGVLPDEALAWPTPCGTYTVGDLVDHVGGLALAFAAAARKDPLDGVASGDAARLEAGWRARITADLGALAEAWDDPEAWTGMTAAGGIDLPGEVAGLVALDELVVHGWDLARAIDVPVPYDDRAGLDAVLAFVTQAQDEGAEGIFGPAVAVPGDAPVMDRIAGLAGRDPAWQPAP